MLPIPARSVPSPERAASLAIEQVSGFLRIARILIEDGRRVDLSGLEGEIGRLCALVLDLDPVAGKSLKAPLSALLSEVAVLEAKFAPVTPTG